MTTLTPDEIRTILVIAEAATNGPWVSNYNDVESVHNAYGVCRCWTDVLPGATQRESNGAYANAKFIAHARTDVPRLCAALLEMLEFQEWRKAREAPGFVDAEFEEFRKKAI